jgi:hypothetical protein
MVIIGGEGPNAGLQGASMLEDMLQYCSPLTFEGFIKMHKFDPRLYNGLAVEGEWSREDSQALASMLENAKAAKCIAACAGVLNSRYDSHSNRLYQYCAIGVKRNGITIINEKGSLSKTDEAP